MRMIVFEIFVLMFLLLGCSGAINVDYKNSLDDFSNPFSSSSIWKRKIPNDVEYIDIQDAIWGDAAQSPTLVSVDLVTILLEQPAQPLVDFRLNQGWIYPDRSIARGETLFQRRLFPDDGADVRHPKNGNATYVIIDPATGLADEGVGAWREPGGDFLTFYDDYKLHGLDVINGDGLSGPRGSGLSAFGGCIRSGEINAGIDHAMAVMLSSIRYSSEKHFVWPASRGDDFAPDPDYGYLGNNPDYTMGTLMAIPRDVALSSLSWNTPQGLILATSAQEYGWYIVDSGTGRFGGNSFKFAYERQAAYNDLGLVVNPDTDIMTTNPDKVDEDGLSNDVQQILHLVKAVKNIK